ncbi:hypothetical protein THASP1DRAFT_27069 [Thamnocephalis sphaerospora]|uniref:ADF-H domain-containing protein n=1 Tax=Thamnocephalis sphaerospora TaxID=78915 RepID=A0A4P9XZG4_9FUNG|nr:hypothetical protein THASP1DRAFT_27069 [Thamnocephalis sphaerospora]|eukprot:RKP11151.1 hypothetical protein THASP1DRAFT_27069 [Thamnocephalis sphaerospora]
MSLAANFSTHSQQLRTAYNAVRDGNPDVEWAVFGYDRGTNDLKVLETGVGLDELSDEFSDGKIQYGFARIIEPISQLPKLVLIGWCGSGVPVEKKGLFASHLSDVALFLKGYHLQINARAEGDVDPSYIMKRLGESTGAKYSVHNEQAAAQEAYKPVSSSYTPVNIAADLGRQPNYGSVRSSVSPAATTRVQLASPAKPKLPTRKDDTVSEAALLREKQLREQEERRERERQELEQRERELREERVARSRESSVRSARNTRMEQERAEAERREAEMRERREKQKLEQLEQARREAELRSQRKQHDLETAQRAQQQAQEEQKAQQQREQAEKQRREAEEDERRKQLARAEAERREREKQEKEKREQEQREQERREQEKREQEKQEQEKREQERREREKVEQEKREQEEHKLQEKKLAEQKEAEELRAQQAKEEAEQRKQEEEKLAADKARAQEEMARLKNELHYQTGAPAAAPKNATNGAFEMKATALFDYDPVETDEMALVEGETVVITDKMDDDWWIGTGDGGKSGLFPASYVQVEKSQPAATLKGPSAIAQFDYTGVEDDELTFEEGACITDIAQESEDWWRGIGPDGKRGLFPASYVELTK